MEDALTLILTFLGPDTVRGYLTDLPTLIAYLAAVGTVVVAAKAITVLTPTQVDDKILGGLGTVLNVILRLLNLLALNIGKDRNADDPR